MIDFTKLSLNEGMTPTEQKSSEEAAASSQKKFDPRSTASQRSGRAQKTAPAKSGVIYANEDYFRGLREALEVRKAKEQSRSDWRAEMSEEVNSEEGEHPFVSVMPHANSQENRAKEQGKLAKEMKKNAKKGDDDGEINQDELHDMLKA